MKFILCRTAFLWTSHSKLYFLGFFCVALFVFIGCGGNEEEIKNFITNPKPPSISATVTPVVVTYSQAEQTDAEQDAPSAARDTDVSELLAEESPDPEDLTTGDDSGEDLSTEDSKETSDESEQPEEEQEVSEEETTAPPTPESEAEAQEPPAKNKAKTPEPTPTPVVTTSVPASQKNPPTTQNPETTSKLSAEKASQLESMDTSKPIVTPYGVTIDKLVVCSKISNKNPAGPGESFSLSNTRSIYVWVRVSGVKPTKTIKHIYYWEGARISTVNLKLKYASMRTWSKKTLKPAESLGKWKIVITTTDENEILAVKEFEVVK